MLIIFRASRLNRLFEWCTTTNSSWCVCLIKFSRRRDEMNGWNEKCSALNYRRSSSFISEIIICDGKEERYSPATCRVAFLLTATPTVFLATHQYTPASCSFLLFIVLRKNKEPAGSRTRWDLLSIGDVLTGSPSLNHSIVGSGLPSALQFNVTGSFFATIMSEGCSVMRGERYWAARKKRKTITKADLLTNYDYIKCMKGKYDYSKAIVRQMMTKGEELCTILFLLYVWILIRD